MVSYFGAVIIAVNWMLTAFAGLFLGLRLYCKLSRRRGLWWDDYLLIVSFISLVIGIAVVSGDVLLGVGDPTATISPAAMIQLQIHGGVKNVLYSLASDLSKTSFGLTLLQVLEGRIRTMVIYMTALLNLVYFLVVLFTFFKCQPAIYSIFPADYCWKLSTYIQYAVFVGAYSAVVDFAFSLIPWFIVKDLNMKKAEKLGVATAMSFGAIAGVTAVLRTIFLPLLDSPNFSSQATTLAIWYPAEAATTIIAASIPVLRRFVKEIKASVARYFSGEKNDSGASKGQEAKSRSRKAQPSVLHSSRVVTTVVSYHKDPFIPLGDASSDKSIFGRASEPGKSVRTQEARLSYHDRSDNDDLGYVMEVIA
ncbi:hypothetical protein HD806DRAFT_532085 [Xylariaceae sp. AK1471]|nr:hypothetical protein HD806DRAFT_532085 [Xylariaceae sp. AK1471]